MRMLLGDVVLARKDIATSYHLAVVIDDAFQQITHVTRGEDLTRGHPCTSYFAKSVLAYRFPFIIITG